MTGRGIDILFRSDHAKIRKTKTEIIISSEDPDRAD